MSKFKEDAVVAKLKTIIANYTDWTPGGNFERMTILNSKGEPSKPSTIGRRLRDLAEDNVIEKKQEKGFVWYRAKPQVLNTEVYSQSVFNQHIEPDVIRTPEENIKAMEDLQSIYSKEHLERVEAKRQMSFI